MDYIKRQKDARWKNNSLLFKMKVTLSYHIHSIVKINRIQTINLDLSLPIIYIQTNSL